MYIWVPLCSPESSFLQHKKASVTMFYHLVKQNKLEDVTEQHGLVLPEDLDFIKEQIAGPIDPTIVEVSVTAFSFVTIDLNKNRNT